MNINSVNNSNPISFNAKFKIKKAKSYKPVDEYFNEWLTEKEAIWAMKAKYIGNPNDTITITIEKNGIKQGFSYMKQNMSASSKINGIKINNSDLGFVYDKPNEISGTWYYCDNFNDSITEYLEFIKRIGKATIYK